MQRNKGSLDGLPDYSSLVNLLLTALSKRVISNQVTRGSAPVPNQTKLEASRGNSDDADQLAVTAIDHAMRHVFIYVDTVALIEHKSL